MTRVCPSDELLAAAKSGDRKAQDSVVRASMWVVDAQVKRAKRPSIADDLKQAACVGEGGTGGLMGAINTWNPAVGANFWTHATHHIWGAIRRELATAQSTETLASRRQMKRRAVAQTRVLRKQLQREPTAEEVSEAVGVNPRTVEMPTETVVTAEGGAAQRRSALCGRDASDMLAFSDGMSNTRMIDKLEARRAFEMMPDLLTPKERHMIEGHAIDGRTFAELGAELGISREWARRHYILGCKRLRAALAE